MKTIENLINKNVYYLGNNYEYFKHISRYLATQRCKSVFISDKKEAIASIDRELGNMRATSYSYHVDFADQPKYLKTVGRVLKSRETPDILFISFKPEFESDEYSENPMLSASDEQIDLFTTIFFTNVLKTIQLFLECFIQNGKGTIATITTDESTNPLEKAFAEQINHYLLNLNEELKKSGYAHIQCKIFKRKGQIPYERFVAKLTKALDGKRSVITM